MYLLSQKILRKGSNDLHSHKKNQQCSALLVYKPEGITSHTLTRRIVRLTGVHKAGHTGTLDKAAEGLMIVLLDKATRLSRFFLALDKQYCAVFALGIETTSLDREGKVIKTLPPPSEEAFRRVFEACKGEIEQCPPLYSAVHVKGKRAWQRAKENPTLVLKPRRVCIYHSELHSFDAVERRAVCSFSVSSGTYIRSIARDLTVACNSCGYLLALLRTHIADIRLEEAVKLDDVEAGDYQRALIPADVLLRRVRNIDVVYREGHDVRTGLTHGISPCLITTRVPSQRPVMLYDHKGFVGMWEFTQGTWRSVMHMG